jgi:hypothetical protein
MDQRIILEKLDDLYYIVYELATGLEIGGVINRHQPEGPWCAVTPETAVRDVWGGPTVGMARTKEEAAELLLSRLREPQL